MRVSGYKIRDLLGGSDAKLAKLPRSQKLTAVRIHGLIRPSPAGPGEVQAASRLSIVRLSSVASQG